mgnify:CR=1 FL=1
MTAAEAGHAAAQRIFGDAPGAYGTGVNRLTERSGAWRERDEIGRAYRNRMGHAYGLDDSGEAAEVRVDESAELSSGRVHSVFRRGRSRPCSSICSICSCSSSSSCCCCCCCSSCCCCCCCWNQRTSSRRRVAARFRLAAALLSPQGSSLLAGFDAWRTARRLDTAVFPGLPYVMLHSLAHLLITAVALECGYSASSIRERIYAGQSERVIIRNNRAFGNILGIQLENTREVEITNNELFDNTAGLAIIDLPLQPAGNGGGALVVGGTLACKGVQRGTVPFGQRGGRSCPALAGVPAAAEFLVRKPARGAHGRREDNDVPRGPTPRAPPRIALAAWGLAQREGEGGARGRSSR